MLNSETLNDVSQARDAAQAVLDGLEHYRPEEPGQLAEPLAAYAAIISAVNQRLRAAQVLLAKGRREEAIHTCDAEPNLLDCVAALDSCDQTIEAWLPTIEELGLTRPQRLLSDLAEDLGAAYDLRHQMESLMRTHRLLAISRGPIEQRVATLRRIVRTDTGNAQWLEDLVAYERACKALLQDELDNLAAIKPEAMSAPIASRIKKIVAQLSDSSWQDPLNADAVRSAKGVLQRTQRVQARSELESISAAVPVAYRQRDLARCRDLVERMDKLQLFAALSESSPHFQAIRDCRDWVTEEDNAEALAQQNELATDDLRRLLGEPIPLFSPEPARRMRTAVQEAVHTLAGLSASRRDDDSESLLAAGQARLRRLDAVPLRFWAITVLASCTLIGSASGGGWWWLRDAHRQRIIATVKADLLDGPIEDKDLPAAKEMWSNLLADHPWLEGHAIARPVDDGLTTLASDAEVAKKDALANLAAASNHLDKVIPEHLTGLEKRRDGGGLPDDAMLSARDTARKEIRVAEQKATSAEDDIRAFKAHVGAAQVNGLQRQLDELREKLRTSRKVLDELIRDISQRASEQIDSDITRLEDLPASQRSARREDILSLEQQTRNLESFASTPPKSLLDRIAGLRDSLSRQRELETIREKLSESARRGGYKELLSEIEAELSSSPDLAMASDLRAVADEQRCVESAIAWSEVSSSWLESLSCKAGEAKKWLEAIERAQQAAASPDLDATEQSNLDALVAVLEERAVKPLDRIDAMQETMEQPILQEDVLALEGEKGTYYTRPPENKKGRYFRDASTIYPFSEMLKQKADACRPAPHKPLAAAIRKQLHDARQGDLDFDTALMNVFARFPEQKDPEVNPVLRCDLLRMIVDQLKDRKAFEGNEDLQEMSNAIANDFDPETPWINPEYAKALDWRDAEKILANVICLKNIKVTYDKRHKAITTPPWPVCKLVFTGWAETTGGTAMLHTTKAVSGDGRLVIVVPEGAKSFKYIDVANIRDGRPTVLSSAKPAFGQPVFLIASRRVPVAAPRPRGP